MPGGMVIYSGSQSLASGALALRTTVAATGRVYPAGVTGTVANYRRVDRVTLKAGSAISQVVQVILRSAKGASYDTVIDTATLSSATDYDFEPTDVLVLSPGDDLELACANSGTPSVTVYGTIVCEEQ